MRMWAGLIWLGIGSNGRLHNGNEPQNPIKSGEFHDQLRDYQLINKASAP
jgi:hypothetical protein